MRISDERYERDLNRYQLARRMLRLEARTGTISEWTGLSQSRIRKLGRSAYLQDGGQRSVRHRGPPPSQVEVAFGDAKLRGHFVLLATLAIATEALPDARGLARRSLATAERLCSVYELYLQFVSAPLLCFEHLMLLARTITDRNQMRVGSCNGCGGLLVCSASDLLDVRCEACHPTTAPVELRCAEAAEHYEVNSSERRQLTLF